MGCERRVVYDFVNVINGEATLNQALIKDKRCENLYISELFRLSPERCISSLNVISTELHDMGFDFILCDLPVLSVDVGYFVDEAVIMNPEDQTKFLLDSKSLRGRTRTLTG